LVFLKHPYAETADLNHFCENKAILNSVWRNGCNVWAFFKMCGNIVLNEAAKCSGGTK
jgi:hypothetical protein